MEKRKWLWKRKFGEKSPGESESSGSMSSHSERYSDDQELVKEVSPGHNIQSPEVTSKAAFSDDEITETMIKSLTAKLSAALVNVSAKEDLAKQHAKVAEEAVAGWEKAENEAVSLKQQLDATVEQKLALEGRVSHLDGALKECVRQLRQSKDDQGEKIHESMFEMAHEWKSTRTDLENRIEQLQTELDEANNKSPVPVDNTDILLELQSLKQENDILKSELLSQSEELEIRIIERDLSAQVAETASKQNLESIKKVAKLEADCRRLQAIARKSSSINGPEPKSSASHCQLMNEKLMATSHCQYAVGSHMGMDIMDDFLEMERLASLPETQTKTDIQMVNEESLLKQKVEEMSNRVAELEENVRKIEEQKVELEKALTLSQDNLKEAETRLEEMESELANATESRELLEFQLMDMETERRTMSSNLDCLNQEVEKERSLSVEMAKKCKLLEEELTRKTQSLELEKAAISNTMSSNLDCLNQEVEKERNLSVEMTKKCKLLEEELTRKTQCMELEKAAISNAKSKIQQEDIDVAACKLSECQKTIASLGRQLESLATLEDFLIDTANIPGFSKAGANKHLWKLHSNEAITPKNVKGALLREASSAPLENGNIESPISSTSSSNSSSSGQHHHHHVSSGKTRNGFGKLFSRSKSAVQLEDPPKA
ncbi:filament-like plant protein [Impatiens glandulifera]|uniref:filament-like plant protein n=1 Tax=Impatiens glandulifera TaxID=253017 RepID=UPI001FB0E8F0|nr:filament-like plant protein [Impatiens glandulifera]XP_047324323.1 filament-like plant protein [Impatiens glandulifera]XP_047324324.1 filament-like plant protein [Impatiens glandulifera]